MNTDRLPVDRDELLRVQTFLVSLLDADDTPEHVREQAQQRFDELDHLLCFAGADVPNCGVLLAFCGYSEALEEILEGYPPEVLAYQETRVMLARRAAELADSPRFSDLFRLDAVDSLNQILGSIKRAADELLLEVQ
jgi:hypothetical protein